MWHSLKKSDIIFLLCSYDTRVADRVVELYRDWYANKILVSGWLWGGTTDHPRFKNKTEAEVFSEILIHNWIPQEVILLEKNSTNTWENIRFGYELIKDYDIHSMILVQKTYMERRTYATFMKQRPWKEISISITSPNLTIQQLVTYEVPFDELISIMVGDLQRIIEYPNKWYQIFQEVPEDVLASYRYLIDRWFTSHLIT